jgi:hypothetical protein
MVAIVTDSLKQQFAKYLFDEINNSLDSSEFFIGIGKADAYDSADVVVTPTRTLEEEREARNNLQSIKKVTAQSFVIPRSNWTAGGIYSAWRDDYIGIPTNKYYILTEDNEVYICLQQGKNAAGQANTSIVKPSYIDAGVQQHQAFRTSDGYIWKLCYGISAARANSFLSSTYMPVQDIVIDSAGANAFELQQLDIQNTAKKGQIIGFDIVNAGTGYTTAPTITIVGDGSGASAVASVSGGAIVKVEMSNESAGLGSGYNFARANLSAGNAVIRPIIGPIDGFGTSAISDLKSSSIMLNVKPDGNEGGEFNTSNDFRQIVLYKDIEHSDSASEGGRYKGNVSKASRYLTIVGNIATSGFVVDEIISGVTSGTTAYVDELDSGAGNRIWFHQNSNNKAGKFTNGETITGSQTGSATVNEGDKYSLVDPHTGKLLYIENRARVIRSAVQTEDIKVIVTV